jgi:adenylate kinase family enzyme
MERIAIVGCGGSGKTELARRLAERLDLPLTHLDAVYYDDTWNPLPPDVFAAAQERLVAQPRWVIDGNYASTLPIRLAAADTVVVLDLPARTCLWGIGRRQWRHGSGQHSASGVYNRINGSFVRYVLGYRRTMLPRVQQLIAVHASTADVKVLRNRSEVDRFVTSI